MSSQEIRYRRLLSLYPSDFRDEYAEEMLGVLMADPRPARSHVVDLVAGAVAVRFRETLGGSAWREAALAVQLFGAILLCSLAVRRLATGAYAFHVSAPGSVPPPDVIDVVRLVAWSAVVVAACAGLRGLGVVGAVIGLGCEVTLPARLYFDTPAIVLHYLWLIVTATTVLLASIAARGRGPRGWAWVTAAGLVLIGEGFPNPMWRYAPPTFGFGKFLFGAVLLGAAALAGAGVLRLVPEVRRRVIACAVPVVATFPLAQAFSGFARYNGLHPEALHLINPGQWAALVVVPALAFWVAAWLNMRLERTRAAVSTDRSPEM